MLGALLGLYGGLGLFIYGMQLMSDSLQRVAGDRFRKLLERLTGTIPKGLLAGLIVTTLVQSSSATTVMVVGLVNAGLMTLMQAVGVIFGANIGTTITGQLVAFKLTEAALPAVGLGFTLSFFGRRARLKRAGELLLGFGMLFLGMRLMGQYLGPLVREPWARSLMVGFSEHPVLGVLVGAGLTALVQSSSAVTGLIIALAGEGAIGLVAAVPLVLGANIGTTITALLAAIGSSVVAKRSAVVHLLFNLIGVTLIVPFVLHFDRLISGLGGTIPRQIANAHTLFNVSVSLLLLPFASRLAQLATLLVPGEAPETPSGPRFIDVRFLATPALALSQARKEALRMAGLVQEGLRMTFAGLLRNDAGVRARMEAKEQAINDLEGAITDYLAALMSQELADQDSRRVANLLLAVKDLERVGDHAESLARLAEMKASDGTAFSPEAERELRAMFDLVDRAIGGAMRAVDDNQPEGGADERADQIWGLENQLDIMEKDLRRAHIRRLGDGVCTPAGGIVFLDVASHFERIGDHAANIARLMAEAWGD